MVELDKILSERSDERILKAIKTVSEGEFNRLVEALLGYLELKIARGRPKDTFYIADCVHKPDGKSYVAFVSRRHEVVSVSDIQSLISYMGRQEAKNALVITTSVIAPNAVSLAESNNIGLADGAKFAALVRRFDLDKDVVKAADMREARAKAVPAATGIEKQIQDEISAGYASLADRDFMSALDYFDRAILVKEDYDLPWRMKGNTLDEMGYHEQALECYKRALELYPESDEAWFSLGNSLFALGRYEEELKCYDRALQYNPLMQKALINKGSTLHRLGRYEEALETYDKLLRINYRLEKVHNNRGATLHSLGRFKEALSAYNAAIELKHDYVEAWMNKGNLLSDMGKPEESFESFNQITQIRPELAKGWYLRGLAARQLANSTVAKASFEQALKIDSDYADAKKALEMETEKISQKYTEVPRIIQDIFSSEAARAPQAPPQPVAPDTLARVEEETVEELAEEIYGDRAEILFLLGRLDEAFEYLGKSLQLEGENERLMTAAGNVLYALGRKEAAIKTFEHAVAVNPGHVPALMNLYAALAETGEKERAAKVAEKLRDHALGWQARTMSSLDAWRNNDAFKAIEDLDSALALEDLAALNNLKGLMKLQTGDADGAMPLFERNQGLPLDPSEAHNNRGIALLVKGEREKASLEFDKAIKLQRDNNVAWNNRGCVLCKFDRLREGIACFDESLMISPTTFAMTNKGFVQLSLDLLLDAAHTLRESLKIRETPEAYNDLGIALRRMGKEQEALNAFRDALRLAPLFKDAGDNLRAEAPKAKPERPAAAAPAPPPAPPSVVVVGAREVTRKEMPRYTEPVLRGKSKMELAAICESVGLSPRGTKEDLIARLLKAGEAQRRK